MYLKGLGAPPVATPSSTMVLAEENKFRFCKKKCERLAFFTESRYSINFTLKIKKKKENKEKLFVTVD
jgi:hypothetical protein